MYPNSNHTRSLFFLLKPMFISGCGLHEQQTLYNTLHPHTLHTLTLVLHTPSTDDTRTGHQKHPRTRHINIRRLRDIHNTSSLRQRQRVGVNTIPCIESNLCRDTVQAVGSCGCVAISRRPLYVFVEEEGERTFAISD